MSYPALRDNTPTKIITFHENVHVPKVFGYLDLGLLAEVAEAEGVDLRVLYLRRSARDVVVANTVHRDFHK